jgi:hypothetical protein
MRTGKEIADRRAIALEPELHEEVKAKVAEARIRMAREWVSHEDVRREYA